MEIFQSYDHKCTAIFLRFTVYTNFKISMCEMHAVTQAHRQCADHLPVANLLITNDINYTATLCDNW